MERNDCVSLHLSYHVLFVPHQHSNFRNSTERSGTIVLNRRMGRLKNFEKLIKRGVAIRHLDTLEYSCLQWTKECRLIKSVKQALPKCTLLYKNALKLYNFIGTRA